MAVKRIVPNIRTDRVADARAFYGDVLGLEVVMDLGWIATFQAETSAPPQVSVATQGGGGTELPALSIEVDNLDDVHQRAIAGGFLIEYGPVSEPWGVRRFYLRDPFGTLLNVLQHG